MNLELHMHVYIYMYCKFYSYTPYLILYVAGNIQAVNHNASSSVSQQDNYSIIKDCTPRYIVYGEASDDKASKSSISCHYQVNSRRYIVSEATTADKQCK